MKHRLFGTILCFGLALGSLYGQSDEDAFFIRKIYDLALGESHCYQWLEGLTQQVGPRLAGSPQAVAAVAYTRAVLDTLGTDTSWLQPCRVSNWKRGQKPEVVRIVRSAMGSLDLRALALGRSGASPAGGVLAEVVEFQQLDEVDAFGDSLAGKIAFFNRPMDPLQLSTFNAYGRAADQRVYGPARAARYGAVATLVRSLTTRTDDRPHTGVTVFEEDGPSIPALGIATRDADLLSRLLRQGPVEVFIEADCETQPFTTSHNVIAEIRGREFPEEIIVVGGHLDSWDVGQGAHDDGAGCVQSMAVLELLRKAGYRPRRTIRCVLFMDEENGVNGGKAYRDSSLSKGWDHLAAIESDRGGFTPRGFTFDGLPEVVTAQAETLREWLGLLQPYGLDFRKGGSGADVGQLKSQGPLLFGLDPDTQRYFDYHHTQYDQLEAVNPRELKLGAAAMASLVFLLDKYGLE